MQDRPAKLRQRPPPVRIKLALLAEPLIAAQAKARQAEYYGNQYESGLPDICPEVQKEENPLPSVEYEPRRQLANKFFLEADYYD